MKAKICRKPAPKNKTLPPVVTQPAESDANSIAIAWLSHPNADAFFGASFTTKFTILAQVASGFGTQSEIARELKVSRQYISRQAALARRVFGIRHPGS